MNDPRIIALSSNPGQVEPDPFSEHELREQWNAQADEFNQWESLDSAEQLAWAQARAIAADRNGRPTATPAPEVLSAEVKELVAALEADAECVTAERPDLMQLTDKQLTRIAEILNAFILGGWIVPTVEQVTPPAPEVGEVGEVREWPEIHAAHLRKMQEIGVLPETELQEMLDRAATLLQQPPAPAPAVVPDAGGVIDVLIKAEAILADIVEGESPVDHGPSNAHNYFAEQCGYLESELEKCEDLLSIIRSAIQTND